MYQSECITAPCEDVSLLFGLGNKPSSIGAYIFNHMESGITRGIPPKCACGCGGFVGKNKQKNKWNRYIIYHGNKGRHLSPEHLLALSTNPYRQTPEYKEKQRIAQTGRKHSEETKRKMSVSGKNRPPFSEETKERMRIAAQKRGGGTKEALEAAWKVTRGSTHTKEWIEKVTKKALINNKMEGNPRWKGGISFLPYSLDFNHQLKDSVRFRDNFCCQLCGKSEHDNKNVLSVHHIDYNKMNSDPNSLISLCISCHGKTSSGDRNYWQKLLTDKMSHYGTRQD